MNDKIIEVKNLHKSYGQVHAVNGIDFYVERGKLFAFLGPNGAGKSSTIDIICTLNSFDQGEVWIDGHPLGKEDDLIRSEIGVVFQNSTLDNLLTVEENLKIRGSFYGMNKAALKEAVAHAAEVVGIENLMKRPYGKLSGGQKRRCDIARALVNAPKILFLDEPTTGLDPQTRQSVWKTIEHLRKDQNMTVFLTTHYMEEAEEADYVIIIDEGKISAKGTPAELEERYSKDRLTFEATDGDGMKEKLQLLGVKGFKESGRHFELRLANTLDAVPLLEALKNDITSFEVIRGTMDDVFIEVTGKELRE